jgi:6-phosphogluconolactonase/glucosamine-6-phosphate isomerase/deaminase
MQIRECKDENAWVETVNVWLASAVDTWHAKRVFVPAGETPRPLYKSWQNNGPQLLNQLTLVQLDEILVPNKPFRRFFIETLPNFQKKIEFIETAEAGAEVALLGLGLNGHVAFHEPGVSDSFYSGCLQLSPETIARLKLEPNTRGLTYGLNAFLKTKAIALLVRGESKRNILQQIMQPTCQLPAAKILRHKNVTVITDFKINVNV